MRKKGYFCCVLAFILAFLGGCSGGDIKFNISDGGIIHKIYNAVYDCSHEIGRQDGDSWLARNDMDNLKGNLVGVEDLALNVGVYKLTYHMTIDFNSWDIGTVVGIVLIRDAETKENINSFDIARKDIKTPYEYTNVNVNFPLYRERKVDIIFEWQINTMVMIKQVEILSVSPALLRDEIKDGEKLMGQVETAIVEEYNAQNLYHFDMDKYVDDILEYQEYAYDVAYLLFTLQGLVNRNAPHLWITFSEAGTDEYWLRHLSAPNQMLANNFVVEVKEPATLLKLFEDQYTGFVVWDQKVPATSNVAATICGVENRLPLRYKAKKGSLYNYILKENTKEVVSLVDRFKGKGKIWNTNLDSTGSPKNDAYRWAIEKYLRSGKTNPTLIAYHVDAWSDREYNGQVAYPYEYIEKPLYNRMLANKDYYIANKAFFFDLNLCETTVASDEPSSKEGLDFETAQTMLTIQNEKADKNLITMGGFWPWDLKYKEFPGSYEGNMVIMLSKYNCVLDAEAPGYTNITNASVYMHYHGKEQYVNKSKGKRKEVEAQVADGTLKLENKNYVMFFMGDYDSSAWTNRMLNINFLEDDSRGQIPLVWPICPNNAAKIAHVQDAIYEAQTENDYFGYVNSGVGQFMLDGLLQEGRPTSLNGSCEEFINETNKAGAKYDLDFIGFMGCDTRVGIEYYAGIKDLAGVVNTTAWPDKKFIGGDKQIPISGFYNMEGGNLKDRASWLQTKSVRQKRKDGTAMPGAKPNFIVVRSILCKGKEMLDLYNYSLETYPDYEYEVVDPYTYFELYKMHCLQQAAV